jgi:hypothetical protein
MHEQNPVEIPNLTESILENLMPVSAAIYRGADEEVIPDVTAYHNLRNADLDCEYIIGQDRWCAALTKKEMFPWLWNIDPRKVHEKQRQGNWDWKLLARQLSQIKIHEPGDTL